MKPSDFFSALLVFFNDFIGMAAPGFLFLLGAVTAHEPAAAIWRTLVGHFPNSLWLVGIVLSYAVGHVFLSVH